VSVGYQSLTVAAALRLRRQRCDGSRGRLTASAVSTAHALIMIAIISRGTCEPTRADLLVVPLQVSDPKGDTSCLSLSGCAATAAGVDFRKARVPDRQTITAISTAHYKVANCRNGRKQKSTRE